MSAIFFLFILAFWVGVVWLVIHQVRKILRKHRLETENAVMMNKRLREEEAARQRGTD
jgi:hypothetical protein